MSTSEWDVLWAGDVFKINLYNFTNYFFRTESVNTVAPTSTISTAQNCYIPQSDVDWLTQRTHYTSEEIQILYNGFQRDFPDGGILRSHFEIFFLNGKAGGGMANLVFK